MRRYVVFKGGSGSSKRITYYARGITPLAQYRYESGMASNIGANSMMAPIVFDDSVMLPINSALTSPFVLECEVSENQPKGERVAEYSGTGVSIAVYNENGVLVCDNGVTYVEPEQSTPATPNAPGEMTSVPGEEPGEMAGETTDEPGAMI